MDRARAVFRDAVDEPLAVDKQAFGAAELERAFAVLQPLDTARLVGPGARSVDVGRPEQITAAAARALSIASAQSAITTAPSDLRTPPSSYAHPGSKRRALRRRGAPVPRFRGAAGLRRMRSRRFASASLHSAATPLSFRRSAFSRSCLMSWMLSCAMRSAVQSSERSLRGRIAATFMLGARRRRRAGDAEPRLRCGPIAPNTPRRSSPRAARASLRRPPMRGPCRSEILRRRRGARRVGNAGALRRRARAGSTGASCNPSRPRTSFAAMANTTTPSWSRTPLRLCAGRLVITPWRSKARARTAASFTTG